jgi:hypothetical protein
MQLAPLRIGGDGAAPGVVELPDGGIDWGIDMSCVTAEGGADPAEAGGAGAGGGVVEINWDIGDVTVEAAGGGDDVGFSIGGDGGGGGGGFSVGGGGGGGGSDGGGKDLRPFHARLEQQDFRAAVVDELLELRSFLKQRASDLRSKEAASLLSSAPASLVGLHKLNPADP